MVKGELQAVEGHVPELDVILDRLARSQVFNENGL